ncbi:CMRF35-like molecule 8 [Paramisgurnus dabryanus]|uniref:CMRF35-like molecule 8 n=1 Tax=Paramisgurnus dabryanus TaxID=90735 RepID=UPI0031F37B6E
MKICYVVHICMFLTAIRVSTTDEIEMHGYSGKNVIISCHHEWASTNLKYFCKNPCNDGDILVSSDRSPNGRFRLKDFGNGVFRVNITDLQESDSGIYWCGVSRLFQDTYHKVNLRVFKAITPTSTTLDTTQPLSTATSQPETPFAKTSRISRYSTPDDITTSSSLTAAVNVPLYAIGSVIAVIVLICVLVAVYQYRKRIKTSDHVYANGLQATLNNRQIKSKKLNPKISKSIERLVSENLTLNTGQADDIYQNL